jgi:hypothetical protein
MPLPTPDVTLTGNIRSIFNSEPTGKEQIIATLVNYGRNIPTVSGSLLLVDIVQTITPSAVDGSFSQTFFSNLVISPGPNTTYYQLDFLDGNGEIALSVPFQFTTAGSFNLASLTPYGGPFLQPPFGSAILANPNALQTIALFQLNVPSLGVKGSSSSYTNIVSNATATRTFTLPDANSNPVQPATAPTHQFATGVSASGVISFVQPAYTDISGTPILAQTKTAVTSNWLRSYDATTGLFTASQPAFSDISGTASTAQIPNLDASKITTGLIPLARGGTGADLSATGGASQVLKQASSGAVVTVGQLAFSDISGTLTAGQEPSTTVNAVVNDTNITGSIASQTLTLGFTGTVAAGRLNSNVVQSVTNDTNVTGSIAAQALTLGWTGTLVKGRTLATTVYTDQANTFGAFLQKFQAGANFDLVDPTDTTKITQFDLSHITTGTTRTVNVPDANSTTVQSSSAASHQFATGVSAQGVVSYAQPAFSDINGSVAASQLPNPSATTLGGIESIAAVSHKWINSISTSGVPSLTQPAAADLSDGTTGSGSVVLATSPSLTTPNIGAATATSLTGLTGAFTPNAAGGTDIGSSAKPFANLYIGGAATNNIKITGTALAARTLTIPDADTVTVQPFGGASHQFVTTILTTGQVLSAQPHVSDLADGSTGSGSVVLATSPTLVTPTLGVASATSINKVTITAPASGSTLTIADGKTLTVNNTLTFAGTDATTLTFQSTGTVVNRDSTDTFTHKTIDTGGTGNHIQIAGVDLPNSIGTSGQVLTNNSGVLAFTTAGGGGGGTPGGATNSIQYNNGSSFSGSMCLTPAGTIAPNAAFISSIKTFSSTGNNDLYTCPANKRAIITEMTVFNGHATNSSTLVPMLKIGGVYYPAGPSTSIIAQSTGSRSVTYVLEAGEIIAANMTQQPFNVVVSIMEFDNTSNLKSAKLTTSTLTSGDNTVYTVPNGKSALVLNNTLTMCSGTQGTFTAGNNSGGNVTYKWNVVPSGGSVGTTNQMSASTTISTGAGSSQTLTGFTIGAGDFISVNLSSGTADQIAFVTVVEM